ncbi:MAG: prohibitin family protein [Armatimonadetes bacterium]|nr:prohibitin family protein [Armatimonadota bacterium]
MLGLAVIGLLMIVFSFAVRPEDPLGKGPNLRGPITLMRFGGGLLVVVGVIGASLVIVKAGYSGVRLKFGAVNGQFQQGIHWITPGVETVTMMEVRTQKEESQATAASRDLQEVTTDLALNFKIDQDKAAELYASVGKDYKIRVIDPAVQEAIKVVTAQYTAEDLIRKRQEVKTLVETEITNRLKKYHLLVEPGGLSITNFKFSEEFNRAIEAKQVAQQEAEKQKYVLQQAELEKQTKIARAQGEAESAKLNAEALKVNGGSLVIAREWIEKWDGKLPQVSAGASGSGGGGFIIDLKSLLTDKPAGN